MSEYVDEEAKRLEQETEQEYRDQLIEHESRILPTDSICRGCTQQYKTGFRGMFTPTCNLTCDIQIREKEPLLKKELDPAQQKFYKMMSDPVTWCRTHLRHPDDVNEPWEPRWYQLGPMQCSAQMIALRYARQTGKTQCLADLITYLGFTKPNYRMVLVCPLSYQVDEVFSRIRSNISASPILSARPLKKNSTSQPQMIEFPDGAFIKGFTAKDSGDNIRGQSPHHIFIDEVGLIAEDVILGGVMPYLSGKPNVKMWISGTPKKRDFFYQACYEPKLGFKQFRAKSSDSPTWTKRRESFYRTVYPRWYYEQEFEGEFGDIEKGVYQSKFIDRALEEYDLDLEEPRHHLGWTYSIGVDWNGKGIGTVISVIGLSPDFGKFRLVEQVTIDPAEFTQNAGITAITKLSLKWKPISIYCDQGHGETNIENLWLYGQQNPHTRLDEIVKGVAMGGKQKISDPSSGAVIEKYAKELMIDLSVRQLEKDRITLPKSEDGKKGNTYGLVGQMRNYEVVKYLESGRRKFSMENDHAIVSWALGIMAILIEHPNSEIGLGSYTHSGVGIYTSQGVDVYREETPGPGRVVSDEFLEHLIEERAGRSTPKEVPMTSRETNLDTATSFGAPVPPQSSSLLDLARRKYGGSMRKSLAPRPRKNWKR